MYLKEAKEKGILMQGFELLSLKLNQIFTPSQNSLSISVTDKFIELLEESKKTTLANENAISIDGGRVICPVDISFSDLIHMQSFMYQIKRESNCQVKYVLSPMSEHEAGMFINVLIRGKKQVYFNEPKSNEYFIDSSCLEVDHLKYYVFYERYFNKYHFVSVNKR